jgi:hypothetical protein
MERFFLFSFRERERENALEGKMRVQIQKKENINKLKFHVEPSGMVVYKVAFLKNLRATQLYGSGMGLKANM